MSLTPAQQDQQAAAPTPSHARLWRVLRWLIGGAMLITVVLVAFRIGEEKEFLRLLGRVSPAWVALAVLLQVATYVAQAGVWQTALERARHAQPLTWLTRLGLAKLFVDQAAPSGGISGTVLVVAALERRGVDRPTTMGLVVLTTVSYYASYVLALGVALALVWTRGELPTAILILAAAFLAFSATVCALMLVLALRGQAPAWLDRIRWVGAVPRALAQASRSMTSDAWLTVRATFFQLAIVLLDVATLWALLRGLGLEVSVVPAFASFMLSTLARTMIAIPGGVGVFEGTSVATLRLLGVPVEAALGATLLLRGLTFWLPMVPGLVEARRLVRAPA